MHTHLRVGRQVMQRSNVQSELPRFREFAEAGAEAQQMIGSHGIRQG